MMSHLVDQSAPVVGRAVGHALRRKEDQRLLTGQGRFTDDFAMPGQCRAVMVRSPYPHARILAIETRTAAAMPGVLSVLTGRDCAADGLKPIPHEPLPKTKYDMKLAAPVGREHFFGPHWLLPVDKARHVGEAVAMVVAETQAQALDAAEQVEITWEELPWVEDQMVAMSPGAPAVWDNVPDNVFIDTWFGDREATDAAVATAAHVVTHEVRVGRVTAVTLEPRAALGHYDAASGRYTLYAGSGGAVRQKAEIAQVLGIEPNRLRVLSYDVGGNFGAKNRPYVEFGLVLWASAKVGRPVKFVASRSEAFLTDYQGRDLHVKIELALDRDGRFLALRSDNVSNVGARAVSLSPLGKGSGLITGSYDIPVASLRSRAVFTTTMMTQAYRSSGRPEVNFAIERLIDKAARQTGIDRVELRRRNFVRPEQMPYRNAVGAVYDSGAYEAQFDLALRIADAAGFAERKAAAAARGIKLGLGIAPYVESSIGTPRERAEVYVNSSGRVRLVIGTQPSGQGHETSFAQVLADLLHVPVEHVDVVMGDTDIVSIGGGSHSGRSMRHAATVMSKATRELAEKGKGIVARILATDASSVVFQDGCFTTAQSNRSFDVVELAREIERLGLGDDPTMKVEIQSDNEMHDPVFPNGCAICEIAVDPETGQAQIMRYAAVDDVGRCINPMIVHGQTHGGIAQGVGQAMWESCTIDLATGQPTAGSLLDYPMPKADALPMFDTEIAEVLSPTNPLGIKAGGEGGTTPALSAVVNALLDALADEGVTDLPMPTTPMAIWQAIQDARKPKEKARS